MYCGPQNNLGEVPVICAVYSRESDARRLITMAAKNNLDSSAMAASKLVVERRQCLVAPAPVHLAQPKQRMHGRIAKHRRRDSHRLRRRLLPNRRLQDARNNAGFAWTRSPDDEDIRGRSLEDATRRIAWRQKKRNRQCEKSTGFQWCPPAQRGISGRFPHRGTGNRIVVCKIHFGLAIPPTYRDAFTKKKPPA